MLCYLYSEEVDDVQVVHGNDHGVGRYSRTQHDRRHSPLQLRLRVPQLSHEDDRVCYIVYRGPTVEPWLHGAHVATVVLVVGGLDIGWSGGVETHCRTGEQVPVDLYLVSASVYIHVKEV